MYMENVKEHYWRYSLITIILGLGVILFFKITPFLGGILGAFTIYILLRGQMFHLTEKLNTGGNNLMFLNPNHIGDLVGNQQNSKY